MLAVMSLPFAAQKCKRYDMIALLLQTAPKVYHSLPKAIITLNSPQAIIAGVPAVEQVRQFHYGGEKSSLNVILNLFVLYDTL